jgi:hypothetical protein
MMVDYPPLFIQPLSVPKGKKLYSRGDIAAAPLKSVIVVENNVLGDNGAYPKSSGKRVKGLVSQAHLAIHYETDEGTGVQMKHSTPCSIFQLIAICP